MCRAYMWHDVQAEKDKAEVRVSALQERVAELNAQVDTLRAKVCG